MLHTLKIPFVLHCTNAQLSNLARTSTFVSFCYRRIMSASGPKIKLCYPPNYNLDHYKTALLRDMDCSNNLTMLSYPSNKKPCKNTSAPRLAKGQHVPLHMQKM